MATKKEAAHGMSGALHEQFLIRVDQYNIIQQEKEQGLLAKQLRATLNGRKLILDNSGNKK